ncbi:hypothetical protein GGR50DRAFT_500283 [Xylaria sp. CBS 124048]|nr:hypothetical protein GGR50DRAFT_500283 [Xylaria sp. CBS 124048]
MKPTHDNTGISSSDIIIITIVTIISNNKHYGVSRSPWGGRLKRRRLRLKKGGRSSFTNLLFCYFLFSFVHSVIAVVCRTYPNRNNLDGKERKGHKPPRGWGLDNGVQAYLGEKQA